MVAEGDKIKVEKIEGKEGGNISITDVLMAFSDEKDVQIGKPILKDMTVSAKILQQAKGDKVIVYKKKAKKRYERKRGHRQLFTELEIEKISKA